MRWQEIPPLQRFEMQYVPEPNSGCWLWTGAVAGKQYGTINIGGRSVYAHRFSYETFIGPIPEGLVIDHKCRVHCCVNPAHLEPVTYSVNILRGDNPALVRARHANRTACKKGHPLKGGNLYVRPDGARICRICSRAQAVKDRLNQIEWRRAYNRLPHVKAAQAMRARRRRERKKI